jgi:uncharacterized protein YkwD
MIIDLLIIILFLISAYKGYRRGLIGGLLSLVGLGVILIVSWSIYPFATPLASKYFHTPAVIGSLISFVVIFITAGIIWNIITDHLILLIPVFLRKSLANKILGIIPSIIYMFVYISVVGWFLINYPFPGFQPYIDTSKFISPLAHVWDKPFLGSLNKIDSAIRALGSTTASSESNEPFKKINIPYNNLSIDAQSEEEMLALVNQERTSRGLNPLTMSVQLQAVARAQAKDMWVRQFFSHINPDGLSPFDRLNAAKIPYIEAGENLALAPDVQIAHQNLMASPKHKENILYPTFKKVGIGVVDSNNSSSGLMFVQVFSN